jgi:hypothetical protein
MYKLTLAALIAACSASAPPVLSLDLSNNNLAPYNAGVQAHAAVGQIVAHKDFSMKCRVNQKDCPMPTCKALDHNGNSLGKCKETVLAVDIEGKAISAGNQLVAKPDFNKKGTYLLKYNANDKAGNAAEQITVALIVDDTTPPKIDANLCIPAVHAVQAATSWRLCDKTKTSDNETPSAQTDAALRYTVRRFDLIQTGPDTYNEAGLHKCRYLDQGVRDIRNSKRDCCRDDNTYVDPNTKKSVACRAGRALATSTTFLAAQSTINTLTTGTYTIDMTTHDTAGAYGHSGRNNVATKQRVVHVVDTLRPVVSITGATPIVAQCNKVTPVNKVYVDAGATASDQLDSNPKVNKFINVAAVSDVNTKAQGTYTVVYSAQDAHKNKATPKTRTIKVVDTVKPKVTVLGQKALVHTAGQHYIDASATCYDDCTSSKLTTRWVVSSSNHKERKIDLLRPGKYTMRYTCTDAGGRFSYDYRVVDVQDKSKPKCIIRGKTTMYFEASRDLRYTDQGAYATDQVDDYLKRPIPVKTSGSVVNMRKTGTYKIYYDCKDSAGISGDQVTRTVIVKDTRCPRISMKGKVIHHVEAGFPYVDAGATATDDLDGDITRTIKTWGNTVDSKKIFYAKRNCQQIREQDRDAKDGEYYVTRASSSSKSSYMRVKVTCNFEYAGSYGFKVIDAKTSVNPFKSQGECKNYGMEMFRAVSNQPSVATIPPAMAKVFIPKLNYVTNRYLCVLPTTEAALSDKEQQDFDAHSRKVSVAGLTGAETGVYNIYYTVSDLNKNKQCAIKRRTVIVQDTLPPIITLSLKKTWSGRESTKILHVSSSTVSKINGKANPARSTVGNPFIRAHPFAANVKLMAEEQSTSSVNGWVLGAAASAVTGLALLGFSAKKSTVTTVPV